MKGRNWICTFNNPPDSAKDWLAMAHEHMGATYTVGQLEVGEKGTPHVQFFMNFSNSIRCAKWKKFDKKIHFELAVAPDKAIDYCQKEDTRTDGPWSHGSRPIKRNSKTDWAKVKLLAKAGKIDEIPPDIFIRYYSTLKLIAKDHMKPQADFGGTRGVWIYGVSGCGKSRYARANYPEYYTKNCDQWWDGYSGQKNVIMDDLCPKNAWLGPRIKIWGDRYGCTL